VVEGKISRFQRVAFLEGYALQRIGKSPSIIRRIHLQVNLVHSRFTKSHNNNIFDESGFALSRVWSYWL